MILSCQRPYSIRTRIKTLLWSSINFSTIVRDHIPLEQGLRPSLSTKTALPSPVRDHIPLEQGLRPTAKTWFFTILGQRPYSIRTRIKTLLAETFTSSVRCQRPYSIRTRIKTWLHLLTMPHAWRVRDHIPLEQGLRQDFRLLQSLRNSVRDHIPLEQGLRRLG